jgi:hypothetical protein
MAVQSFSSLNISKIVKKLTLGDALLVSSPLGRFLWHAQVVKGILLPEIWSFPSNPAFGLQNKERALLVLTPSLISL